MIPDHIDRSSFPPLELFQDLLESHDLLEKMGEIAKIGAWKVDLRTNKASWTKQLYNIYELDSSTPLTLEEILQFELPQYRSVHRKVVQELMERGTPFDLEIETLTAKGNHRWLRIIGKGLYDPEGKITHRIGITQDITTRKEIEQKILSLLKEKEILLKEVHHRVKNHMQTVTSLLQLQANASEDPYIIQTLEEANNKLKSLGILYDKLYRTHQIRQLSLREYLPTLVREIIDSFPKKILLTLEEDIQDIVLQVNQLSSVGIIVNELITNSLKYAFTGRTEGRIRVSAQEYEPEGENAWGKPKTFVSLIVEDDGIGIPESIDLTQISSFGLQLIEALTHQLGGSLRITRQKGTKFELVFPKL